MPEINYEELTLIELLEIIDTSENDAGQVDQAFEELRVRAHMIAKGFDRPTVPPRNP